jgi:hypothetical protein
LNNVIKFRQIKPEGPDKSKPAAKNRRLTWQPWAIFFAVVLAIYAYQHMLPLVM